MESSLFRPVRSLVEKQRPMKAELIEVVDADGGARPIVDT
jgi:hypothetical protein